MSITRNQFLKVLSLSATASLTNISGFSAKADSHRHQVKTDGNLTLGLASYTLRKMNLDEVIKICQRLGLTSLALKSMHMPLESSADDIKSMAEKIRNAGLRLYGAGVIYMKTAQEVETAFSYAAHAGLEMIIGVPNHDLLPLVNEQVKKYNIKLAIHNHGPGDDLYKSPADVYTKVKSLDRRIGLCIDIGHVVRIGQDPVPMIEKYKDRLYDMHLKDVDKAEANGTSVEIGRGVIDIPKVIQALNKIKYQGCMALEYEKDDDDPVPGLAESVGYVRGVVKMA
ncbi:MAG: sugar phosphate isomerase/epimerase [Cyclobacteriaceae bacterium]